MSQPAGDLEGDHISEPHRRRKRGLLIALSVVGALVLIMAAIAGGSYWWFSAKVHGANEKIDTATESALATKPPSTIVSVPRTSDSGSGSMDIILLGNDTRGATVESAGSSDVIMLLHVDRDLDFLSILSITRDLYVDIPGHDKDRINSAYYLGGAPLAITTIKQVFGVDATKYVGVGFQSFEDVIDSLGGVYVDVDRRYTDTPYWPIDLWPGYQLLDGANALLFARYRFDGNADFGRMARQQRILAAARDQATGWNLPTRLPGLVSTVLGSAATNLSANDMLKLAYWLVKLDGSRIKQIMIKGPGQMIDGKAVVVVDQATLADAVVDYLTPPQQNPAGAAAGDFLVAAAGTRNLLSTLAAPAPTTQPASGPGSLADISMWQSAQAAVPFALEAPVSIPEGFAYADKMPKGDGTYGIKVGDGTMPAVRVVYRYQDSDLYLGITATTWTDAPIAGNGREVERNGVVYTMVGTSGKVDHIWWKENGVLYFISNTLMGTVGEQDLLTMAESMTPVSEASP
jgi:polyisoprenyl-teichoic acid--peptidoglycan teichoic acid transferase